MQGLTQGLDKILDAARVEGQTAMHTIGVDARSKLTEVCTPLVNEVTVEIADYLEETVLQQILKDQTSAHTALQNDIGILKRVSFENGDNPALDKVLEEQSKPSQ